LCDQNLVNRVILCAMCTQTRRAVSFIILFFVGVPAVSAAQECAGWSRPRAYSVGGAYVVGVVATAAIRGGDWWRGEPTGSFKVVWDGTPALESELLRWLGGFEHAPRHTFLVHGEPSVLDTFAGVVRDKRGWKVSVAKYRERAALS